MSAAAALVVPLGPPSDFGALGGKAAALAEVVGLRLPVPSGFVVTTHAFALFLEEHGLTDELRALVESGRGTADELDATAEKVRELFTGHPVPELVGASVAAAVNELEATSFAVRSSATAEDLPTLSFAGQQDTYLRVPLTEIEEHVRRVWASLYTPRAMFYRARHGVPETGLKMAVLVQEMVEGDVSGVMFTSDPQHHQYVLVEAIQGLGEALVSGRAEPASYMLSKRRGRIVEAHDTERGPLPAAQLTTLWQIGVQLAEHFGCEQDVEFTVRDRVVYVLQARPITGYEAL